MKKMISVAMFATSLALVGCATVEEPEMTPLEIQSMQSRLYEAPKSIVFPSIISVFQDLGYTISQGDIETGLITADSATQNNALSVLLLGSSSTSQTRATAFVEERGGATAVRLNFVQKRQTSSSYGMQDRRDTPIMKAEVYQNAFERIENAVFIRQSS